MVTAKHGQNPRVGNGQLIADSLIPDTVLAPAGVAVAQQTADDVSLVWLADQGQTGKAVDVLNAFVAHGTIGVYIQGVKSTVPASQVIDKVLSGDALQDYNLGNPRKDSTTPDIIVTLKPGYIFVGHPLNYHFKRAEYGGFSADDTRVTLIVGSGGLDQSGQGSVVDDRVETTQIAVTALKALGLDPHQLQGAQAEHTQQLPDLKLEAVADRLPAEAFRELRRRQRHLAAAGELGDIAEVALDAGRRAAVVAVATEGQALQVRQRHQRGARPTGGGVPEAKAGIDCDGRGSPVYCGDEEQSHRPEEPHDCPLARRHPAERSPA